MSDIMVDELLSLHLVSTGLIDVLHQKGGLVLPYPIALQRGLDRVCATALRRNETPPRNLIDLLD